MATKYFHNAYTGQTVKASKDDRIAHFEALARWVEVDEPKQVKKTAKAQENVEDKPDISPTEKAEALNEKPATRRGGRKTAKSDDK